MGDNVSFTEVAGADPTPRADANETEMRNQANKSLDRKEIAKQVMTERGIQPPVPAGADIPAEMPKMFFKIGGRVIKCPQFELDDAEAEVLAKHLTILTGGINSKIFSSLVIIVIIGGKVMECFEAIKRKIMAMFPKKEEKEKEKTAAPGAPGDKPAPKVNDSGEVLPELLK